MRLFLFCNNKGNEYGWIDVLSGICVGPHFTGRRNWVSTMKTFSQLIGPSLLKSAIKYIIMTTTCWLLLGMPATTTVEQFIWILNSHHLAWSSWPINLQLNWPEKFYCNHWYWTINWICGIGIKLQLMPIELYTTHNSFPIGGGSGSTCAQLLRVAVSLHQWVGVLKRELIKSTFKFDITRNITIPPLSPCHTSQRFIVESVPFRIPY